MNFRLYVGFYSQQKCPNCDEFLLVNSVGDRWCISSTCSWSNNPKITELSKKLKKKTILRDWT